MPTYLVLTLGQKVPADGVFLSLADARAADKAMADHDLDMQHKVDSAQLEQHHAEKREVIDAFLARWGWRLALFVGLVAGGVAGGELAAHH